jgi:hypothetical protein
MPQFQGVSCVPRRLLRELLHVTKASIMNHENRWASITDDDHSGTLYIVIFLGLAYSGITFLTRLLIKWHILGVDDLAMVLAEVLLRLSEDYTHNS